MPWLDPPDPFARAPRPAAWSAGPTLVASELSVVDGWCEIDGVFVDGGEIDAREAQVLVITASRLEGVTVLVGDDTRVRVLRSELEQCDLGPAAIESLLASRLVSCNLRGAVFADTVRDVLLVNCQLSHAYFGAATLDRVAMGGCVLRETDFYRSTLTDLAIDHCEMDAVNFDATTCERVDLRATNLDLMGVRDLTGCLVTADQVQALALQLADAVGLSIEAPDC